MMEIRAEAVKELREKTGAGFMDCKKALAESAAATWSRPCAGSARRGLAAAAKKAGRATSEGLVGTYLHAGGRIGVLVEVNCETDFVAKTPDFQNLVKELAMQVAAASPALPRYVRREEVPAEVVEQEREIYRAQAQSSGSPTKVIEKIVDGKVDKFLSDVCLLEQPFIRDPERTVKDVVTEAIAKLGENITRSSVRAFPVGRSRLSRLESTSVPEAFTGRCRSPNRSALRYRRVLLKLSGEALAGKRRHTDRLQGGRRRSPRRSRKSTRSGASSPSSSVAATSCAGCRRASTGSTARPATTWACWRR